ncbi:hypothetical protein H2508_04580 [Parahaliea sp. F7430]|uniref:Uncharacterized protein n=2 Tax=Sediminihaliea albiluteola TaxID=2758564 RepID=A0A7W2TUW6_9GAMM|nr:hypothetical protein [Sediminihaliea albiluteola]
MRKLRERRAEGIRVLQVEVGIETAEMLIETDYLSVDQAHDYVQVSRALARFIEDATESVTSHSITLDAW